MDRTLLPNATQFPDVLTDQIMPLVSGDEWKVIHYGVRYALGHRSTDTLTIAQFAQGRQDQEGNWADHGTGLDEETVRECLAFLCEAVHIFLREDRPRKPLGYRLNLDLSSINWTTLEKRRSITETTHPVDPAHEHEREMEQAPKVETPLPPPPRPARRKSAAVFVETPTADLRLDDASDRPVLEKLLEHMNTNERQTFDHLIAMAREHRIGDDEDIVWPIYRLWHTYGFRRLQNAFQSPLPVADLGEINQSCLVGAVTEMLDVERIGPITPSFRDQVVEMAKEWPKLIDWKNAVDMAVKLNKRRLKTVETILKNNNAPPVVQGQGDSQNARATTPAQGSKRPARRQSEYSEEERQAAREADRGKEWTRPADE
jgi:hypothetical protein